MKTHYSPEFC